MGCYFYGIEKAAIAALFINNISLAKLIFKFLNLYQKNFKKVTFENTKCYVWFNLFFHILKLIMKLLEIILTIGRGVMFVITAIAVVWFSPALLLKKLELDFLASVVGVILLILGLTFFQYALKPTFLLYWNDF
ncbi:hypothetical protein [Vibrio rhodolitus]|uniref:hypothetical protein n=1 Tax=Vibrio rhodolitus TaxID=2231649 RepID=UPI000E0C8FDE|nr:hypothetical protein [Vibrio rhodolitus]